MTDAAAQTLDLAQRVNLAHALDSLTVAFPPNRSDRSLVEAPVKPAATFLSGIAVLLAGAFIRACQSQVPGELLNAWCGPATTTSFASLSHAHCTGCVVMLTGVTLIGASLIRPARLALRRVRT